MAMKFQIYYFVCCTLPAQVSPCLVESRAKKVHLFGLSTKMRRIKAGYLLSPISRAASMARA
jgi:hypothetical protein